MMTKKKFPAFAVALGLLGTVSCSNDDNDTPPVPKADLTFNILKLQPLTEGAQYEGWIKVGEETISTGKFSTVNPDQKFSVEKAKLDAATEFIVTIEAPGDNDNIPSDTKILSGTFINNVASVTTNIIGDFNNSTGTFVMATPTDDDPDTPESTMNNEFGLWFMDPNGGSPVAGLKLPILPKGWKYEGWLVTKDTPVSTGTFSKLDDVDDASPYSGNKPSPNFPGEDFLSNAPQGLTFPADGDVRNKKVIISIEPSPDYDQATPFYIKPLEGKAGEETAPVLNKMLVDVSQLPFGQVSK